MHTSLWKDLELLPASSTMQLKSKVLIFTGGKATKNVHYRNIQDHTETVAVEFNPEEISYETLMKFFWTCKSFPKINSSEKEHCCIFCIHILASVPLLLHFLCQPSAAINHFVATFTVHNPSSSSRSRQYMTACFTHGVDQAAIAAASFDAVKAALGRKPSTTIAPLTRFYVAEDYHQKYYLRTKHSDVLAACGLDSDEAILTSPLAAKLNSFVSGDGDLQTLQALQQQYALPDAVVQRMSRRARAAPKPTPELPDGAAAAAGGGGCAIM